MTKNVNLLERFALKDGGKGIMYDKATGKLDTLFLNMNNVALSVTADTVQAKENGEQVVQWSLAKTGELTFESETSSFKQLALSLGSAGLELTDEAVDYHRYETFEYVDASSLTYTLSKTAKNAENVEVHLVSQDGEIVKSLIFSLGVDKQTVTITSDSDISAGDNIRIDYFESITAGKAYRFRVGSKSSQTAKKLVLDLLGTNINDNSDTLMQFIFHKVVISDGIDVTFDSENATTFQVKMTILADSSSKIDDDTNGFFDVIIPNEDDEDSTTVPTITDLTASGLDDSASLTWSAPSGATSVSLLYKLSTDSTYSSVTIGGGAGVRIASALDSTSTSTTVLGLADATAYNFKISYVFDSSTYESNIATTTTI